MGVAEDFLVAGVGIPDVIAMFLRGVAARLVPLCLVPREGGVLVVPRSARLATPGVGDLETFLLTQTSQSPRAHAKR